MDVEHVSASTRLRHTRVHVLSFRHDEKGVYLERPLGLYGSDARSGASAEIDCTAQNRPKAVL